MGAGCFFRVLAMCGSLLLCMSVSYAQAIPCKVRFPNPDQLDERLSCLETVVDNLDALFTKYFEEQGGDIDKARAEISVKIEGRFGPVKKVTTIPGGIYVSDGFWAYRKKPKHYWCSGKKMPKQPPGTIQIAGKDLSKDYAYSQLKPGQEEKARRCVPNKDTDCLGGEYCRSRARSPGCFINEEWYSWAVANTPGGKAKLKPEVICAKAPPPAER